MSALDDLLFVLNTVNKGIKVVKAIDDISKEFRSFSNAESGNDAYWRCVDNKQYNDALYLSQQEMNTNGPSKDLFMRRGYAHFENGDYYRAIDNFTSALNYGNDNHCNDLLYYMRGRAYDLVDNAHNAWEDYTACIQENPNYSNAYVFRGNKYCDAEWYDYALNDYNKAISLDGNNELAYYRRGLLNAYVFKNYNEALHDFSMTKSIDPSFIDVYSEMSFVKHNLGYFQDAINDANIVLRQSPFDAFAYFVRGHSFKEIGNRQQALLDLKKAAELDSDFIEEYNELCNEFSSFNRSASIGGRNINNESRCPSPYSGTVTQIYVNPGDWVNEGDYLLRINVNGYLYDLQSSVSGYINNLYVQVGSYVRAGDTFIGYILNNY